MQYMRSSRGFQQPFNEIEKASSFLEVMSVELGDERAQRFNIEVEIPNWVRR